LHPLFHHDQRKVPVIASMMRDVRNFKQREWQGACSMNLFVSSKGIPLGEYNRKYRVSCPRHSVALPSRFHPLSSSFFGCNMTLFVIVIGILIF